MFRFIITLFLLLAPAHGFAQVLTENTVWSGSVEVREDILIPSGISLTVQAGTVVTVWPSESTKIDPEYMSHRTEILIRGQLLVEGSVEQQVIFQLAENEGNETWAGLIVDQGTVSLQNCIVRDAEEAIWVSGGSLAATGMKLINNRYGLVVYGRDSKVTLLQSQIQNNEYGVLLFKGAILEQGNVVISNNRKKNIFENPGVEVFVEGKKIKVPEAVVTAMYGNEALLGTTIWKGKIIIDGLVRVPPDARLVILPGTVIEFSFHDTNDDGIGESGLLIQGNFLAKGTAEKPIVFRAKDGVGQRGYWDSINILGSDQSQNLIEYCLIEDAYRGMHFHFANVAVNQAVLRNNYRAIQFQESLVSITNSQFLQNKSAIQARDSQVVFQDNDIFSNTNGANFLRLDLQVSGNVFANNDRDGLRIREGASIVEQNHMVENRFGLMVADAMYGVFQKNTMLSNLEAGIALRNVDHVEVLDNAIELNGFSGIIARESRGIIAGNIIAENGERGLGVISFAGLIHNNSILANGIYGIGLEGSSDVDASSNWWGESELDKEIFDRHDDPELGLVTYEPQLGGPINFKWPTSEILSPVSWLGKITVSDELIVENGVPLAIRPGTEVYFGKQSSMKIYGSVHANGSPHKRIVFTSSEAKPAVGEWGEIGLEQATESSFVNCDFEYASWALHVHFTPLIVKGCRFRNNDGGVRFRSGPMEISKSLFSGNRIGIRSYKGKGRIIDNKFVANEIAIFVREEGGGIRIKGNGFENNYRYAIRLGDFNRQDVDARGNWWGKTDPADAIFDNHQEGYIGTVFFEPMLKKPVVLDLN